jgi:hypothetical protein
MMPSAPRVSVVAYVHDYADYLDRMLSSVVGQTFEDFELFVLDDGSTDGTGAVVTPYLSDRRVRYERQDHRGRGQLHETFNRCLKATSGDYIAIANGDDWFHREKLAFQVEILDRRPDVDVSFHDAVFVDKDEREGQGTFRPSIELEIFENRRLGPYMFGWNRIPNPTVLFRRDLLRLVGLQEYGWSHDYQFWLKVAVARARFHFSPDRLIYYRVHELSHSTSSTRRDRLRQEDLRMRREMRQRYAILDLYPEIAECRDSTLAHACAHLDLGVHLASGPNPILDLAAAEFRQALKLAPDLFEAKNNLAVVELLGGASAKGLCQLKTLTTHLPADVIQQNLAAARAPKPEQEGGFQLVLPGADTVELLARRRTPERGRIEYPPRAPYVAAVREDTDEQALQRTIASRAGDGLLFVVSSDAALKKASRAYQEMYPMRAGPVIDVQVVRPDELEPVLRAHRLESQPVEELETTATVVQVLNATCDQPTTQMGPETTRAIRS